MPRVWATLALLMAVWAVSFNVTALPFFPTVLVGAGAAGVAGWWIRRSLTATPPLRLSPGAAALALVVAVAHFLVGRVVYDVGAGLLPAVATSATAVYERTAETPLLARVVLAGLVTAPLEELYWRGALQPAVTVADGVRHNVHGVPLRRTALRGLVLSGALYVAFTAVTLHPALIAAAALGAAVWGGLLLVTGSAGAPMLAHACWTSLMILFPPA